MEWHDFSRENLEAAVTPEVYRRGIEYFWQGHLVRTCKIDNIISGAITGTGGDYKVRLWFEGPEIKGDCSCPYPNFCKHMVALGIAWLEENTVFIDLQSYLASILKSPVLRTNILLDLIHKDPINFLELFPDLVENKDFLSARGIINLIRNTFSLPQFTLAYAEELWEKIGRIEQLIHHKIQENDPAAMELLVELLSGFEKTFESDRNETLIKLWKDEILALGSYLNTWSCSTIHPLLDKLWSLYLNPSLWELAPELRTSLWNLHGYEPDFLCRSIDDSLHDETPLLILVSLYTLLVEAPFAASWLSNCLEQVTASLSEKADGSLWLIDRLIETDLVQAYKLAKKNLHRFPEAQLSFRERLIIIHQQRSEFKQAAAFSFIQFRENPNFEEYSRLRQLLTNAPQDWELYSKKIRELLRESSDKLLTLQIIIAEGDYQGISDNLTEILRDEELLGLAARILARRVQKNFIGLYPHFIKELLRRQSPQDWKIASELMVTFKRYCLYQDTEKEQWVQLQQELQQIYSDNAGFLKKFGTILGE
ncbi:MAG TPA: hypothetical protein DDW50_11740 [Firmicutes bacterium]|jgi:hypothetical protein|nr:hypothetical protein [Bacillota bacterium]